MKKVLLVGFVVAGGWLAQGQTIALWNFESLTAPGSPGAGVWITNIAADVGSGVLSAWHAGSANYTTPSGNGSTKSLSANTWAVGDFFQVVVSTVGYSGIQVSFDQTSSSSGPGRFNLDYSTDGVNFTTFVSNYVVLVNGAAPNAAWNNTTYVPAYHYSFDLSSVTALNNAPTVYFRLVQSSPVTAGGGSPSATGTSRIDNFEVSAVPEPAATLLLLLGAGYIGWARRQRAAQVA
ncbi:MAG: PEP-CTERM sorting domain-containing protein [Verrucomicrobiae bacterium]|nr:PEP-CTERM sorting domain-containing protein [Verrucomicrobiae bacterium]